MLSQNTTTIALTSKGWVFTFPHAKSPVARLYGAYRAILRAGLTVIAMMILFVKYFETGRSETGWLNNSKR